MLATRAAFGQVARAAGIEPPVLDDLLWELGRTDPDLLGHRGRRPRRASARPRLRLVLSLRSRPVRPALLAHPPIGALGLAPQKTRVPIIPMMCTKTMFKTIDLAVAVAADRAAGGGVAVITADQDDRGGHEHRLDQAE